VAFIQSKENKMSKELVVLVIHGMGSQGPDFADEMIEEVNNRVEKLGKDFTQIVWQPIYWADITEPKELGYLKSARENNDLDWIKLRKFMLTSFGDASAYRQVPGSDVYKDIHALIAKNISKVYRENLGEKPKPMLVVAHSLGGHIMSNYIWDVNKPKNKNLSTFERMNYLAGIITFGCNIPLFTFAFDKIEPIRFPPAGLPAKFKPKAKWLNYYDPDDVLGYPLKPINEEYAKVVTEDIAINAGGLLSSWNPMSHTQYWTDNDLTKPVAEYISTFL
jgi:hypothetical protein